MACLRIKAATMVLILSTLVASIAAEDTLFSGDTLETNQFLDNGPYSLIMQGDCNLVLYVNKNRALWSSGTSGLGTACQVTLQHDGDLVILSGSSTVWTSVSSQGTNPLNYILVMQRDGNLVIYGSALWLTKTAQSRKLLR